MKKIRENVEYLETVVDKYDIDEYDVEYISNEWIKEYNRNINILDTVFEEIRKRKMEEETGFAEMAVLEEIKDIEYKDLENLTLSDKFKVLKNENLLEIYDRTFISEIYKKIPGQDNVQQELEQPVAEEKKQIEDNEQEESVSDFSGISGFFCKNRNRSSCF